MVLGWLKKGGEQGVEQLIAQRKYTRALTLLRMEFEAGRRDPRLRLQLADVMVMAGKQKEAVPILLGLADEFAMEGFAAKAISVLKKVQKIQPGRADVDAKLAGLISQKNRPAMVGLPVVDHRQVTFDMEEAAPAAPAADDGLEIGFDMASPDEVIPDLSSIVEADADAGAEAEGDALGDELVALIEDVLVQAVADPSAAAAISDDHSAGRVVSPLFDDLQEDELLEVMRGLQLRSFEPGDVIFLAGEPGQSLFVVASGTAKAFVTREGRPVLAREMDEGTFFGEISILSGGARTATVTAKTRCDLLELDRTVLDDIAERHPRVMDVMREFCAQRLADDEQRGADR
jgi:hypothetical protein